jgi:hypothetical protein
MSTATVSAPELEAYDDGFTPQQSSNFRPGLEAIADGSYDFTILTADLSRTPKTNDLILRWELRVEQTAQVVERSYFFRRQEDVDRLGGDLSVLGFDVGLWKAPARPFSKELPKAVVQLPGRRFKGTKKANPGKDDPSKIYQNLYVNARLPDAAAGSLPPPSTPAPSSAEPPASAEDNEMPF